MRLWIAGAAMLLPLLVASASHAQTECTRTTVERAVPGGGSEPGLVVDCDEPAQGGLLAPDAAEQVCAGAADASQPAATLAACQRAVANAQGLLRRAKIRAALREGLSDEAIQEAFGASLEELDALRESALLSTPLAGGE